MRHIGFVSCPADPDVWMRPNKKPNGSKYSEYVLLYVDDVLCISHQAEDTIRHDLGKYFNLKELSIEPPKIYLGGHCRKVTLETRVEAWGFGSSQYVRSAVKNVEGYLATQSKYSMSKTAETPLTSSY